MSLFQDPNVGSPAEVTWSVSDLAEAIGQALRSAFRDEVWVRGEIRDLSRPQSGHVYLTLTDPAAPGAAMGSGASISVMLHSRQKSAVNAALTGAGDTVRMSAGTDVRIRGRLRWYAPRGQLQLQMTAIDPAYTLGQLELARAELLHRLDAEGLLQANGLLPVPLAPLRIGLVTSVGSAAEADFLDELRRSGFAFEVLQADTRVQGMDAPRSIASALRMLGTHHPDVIALVRGGGARTDLAAFDDEAVARAIAAAPVPVFTGIGHETDSSIADDIGHTSAKTPTACAGLLVARVTEVADALTSAWSAIGGQATRTVAHHDQQLDRHASHLQRVGRLALETADQRLAHHRGRVASGSQSHLRAAEITMGTSERRLAHRAPRVITEADRVLRSIEARVRALDPERALARGWSITRTAAGRVVRHPDEVAVGDALVTLLAGGTVRSTVTETSTVLPNG